MNTGKEKVGNENGRTLVFALKIVFYKGTRAHHVIIIVLYTSLHCLANKTGNTGWF